MKSLHNNIEIDVVARLYLFARCGMFDAVADQISATLNDNLVDNKFCIQLQSIRRYLQWRDNVQAEELLLKMGHERITKLHEMTGGVA